ncbi:MAG: DNA polymerase I [Alphaproteobacteria bacterium]|nr:DNA polymerase I [Alphaproteobacteria bacterium]
MPSQLTLIDGSGFIFRAFHALPPMTRPDGTPVNAVYGYCTMLNKLLGEQKNLSIAVIFDAARKTFRNDIYPDYKAHRPPPPPELVPQFALIREATRAWGLPSIEAPNYEADDLIAAYAKAAVAQGMNVRIVSSDKDLMQLIREGVELFDPLKAIPIGAAEVFKKFGVAPDKVVEVQALAGDSTDNIPGVPGIGVKTAADLINTYGSVENLLLEAANIKQPKRREALLQNAELARISRRLVLLDDAAPLPVPLEELNWERDHREELAAFYMAQNFRSLLAKLSPSPSTGGRGVGVRVDVGAYESQRPPHSTPLPPRGGERESLSDYELIQTEERLKWWIEAARTNGYVALDTETDSLTACTAKLVGISLAIAPGKACYIPVGHIDPNTSPADGGFSFGADQTPQQIDVKTAADLLRDLLKDSTVLKIAHNLKYDAQVLGQHGLTIEPYDDTMLLSYVLAAGSHGHGLDELALLHCQHKMISFDEVTGTGKNRITFDRVPLDKATSYAAEDADYALRLWLLLKPQIAQQQVTRVYERIERPLIPVVAAMETVGVRIDPEILRQQSNGFATRLQKLEGEIHALAGHAFNVGSPQQLGNVLFAEMGLPGGVKGKNGAYSTASDILEPLADAGHEIVAKLLDWRSLAKLKSTYTDSLPQQISAKTGRVHTSFSLVGAATGRLSSTDPNLQNIPIRTEDGRAIRRAFVAEDGYVLLSVDYSQIELRLAASIAGIAALIEAFKNGVDIHALTASQCFGIPLQDMTPDKRRAAKAINFGIIYGISGFGLSKQIGITPAQANEFIRQYLDRFHELRDWMEATKNFARAHGYVETLFGRRIHVPGINEKNPARRNFAERQAINAPLQGTAADIIKRAMIQAVPALKEAKLGAKLLLQVHDELIFEVPASEIDATIKLVKQVMENAPAPAVTLAVPLIAEAGYATNWAEAH